MMSFFFGIFADFNQCNQKLIKIAAAYWSNSETIVDLQTRASIVQIFIVR